MTFVYFKIQSGYNPYFDMAANRFGNYYFYLGSDTGFKDIYHHRHIIRDNLTHEEYVNKYLEFV